jgi:hypothetical protein
MQLTSMKRGRLVATLGLATAQLFAVTGADAAPGPDPQAQSGANGTAVASVADDTQSNLGTTRFDSAVLFYQEQGGRVQAIEPSMSLDITNDWGDVFSFKATVDSLTGATPNGAAPWNQPQTFTTPAHAPSTTATTTSASGNSVLVTVPGTGLLARQYTTPANTLPVDQGFKDHRYAFSGGYTYAYDPQTRFTMGGAVSLERDYTSISANGAIARDFNNKNTTLSLAGNIEYDRSRPFFGTPTPFAVMDATQKGPNATKMVYSVVAGVTQVMNRHWLLQLNYSAGLSRGYQDDPYRILSLVDATTGAPDSYLYEGRPHSRFRQSVYLGNKIALGPTVTDLSARYYHDDWGINAITAEIGERIAITKGLYVEPLARYYHQSAANFFDYYLVAGTTLPNYASSDSRLSRFSATTFGAKIGVKVMHDGEFYVDGERYKQTGATTLANAPGALANQNFFGGVTATSVIAGFRFTFR